MVLPITMYWFGKIKVSDSDSDSDSDSVRWKIPNLVKRS